MMEAIMGTALKYTKVFWQPGFDMFTKITEHPIVKIVLGAIIYAVETFIHEDSMKVFVLLSLIVVDLFTGVWGAVKKKEFTSSKFRHSIIKLMFYCIIIGAFHALGVVSPVFRVLTLDTVALVYLTATEVVSIVENSSKIVGISLPGYIMDKLRNFVKTGK